MNKKNRYVYEYTYAHIEREAAATPSSRALSPSSRALCRRKVEWRRTCLDAFECYRLQVHKRA